MLFKSISIYITILKARICPLCSLKSKACRGHSTGRPHFLLAKALEIALVTGGGDYGAAARWRKQYFIFYQAGDPALQGVESTAFLTCFGVSDIPFKTVSLVPTTDQPSNELPGSTPTTNGWLSGSTSYVRMMQKIPSLFQYGFAFPCLRRRRARFGVAGIRGVRFVSNTGTRMGITSTRSDRGYISRSRGARQA